MLEIAGLGTSLLTGVGPTLAYRRRFVWHKQELFKGRNIVYGTGWAGWGFESNVVASVASAASDDVLRAAPIFEKGPPGMYTNSIPQTLQNKLSAYAIPALSPPVGVTDFSGIIIKNDVNMEDLQPSYWCRNDAVFGTRWLHSDIQDVAFYYTHNVFYSIVSDGGLE